MTPAGPRGWTAAVAAFAAVFLAALLVYGRTVASLVHVWRHSDTFAHGFFVLPICLYLVWRMRDRLAPLEPRPYPLAFIALVPLGVGWFVGRAASTLLVEQFCFVAMLPVLAVAHFGPLVARRMAFPLAFLLFAVPFGDIFQPKLMDITAGFAEQALRLTGVPVSREGLFLAVSNSRWRVVESCSGLRFTIAGVVLATLFAHLSYRSYLKRAVFIASAVVVSIVANGLRAYVLILVGHLSDLRLGGGFDHRAYGWLIFTLVMAGFFMVGAMFRDPEPPPARGPATGEGSVPAPRRRWLRFATAAILVLSLWPALETFGASRAGREHVGTVAVPPPRGAWALEEEGTPLWKPYFHGAASEVNRRYVAPGGSVQCYIAYYANQTQGRELLHRFNAIIDAEDLSWHIAREGDRPIPSGSPAAVTAHETVFHVTMGNMVVWHWYWLPDEFTADPVRAKWLQARTHILGRPDRAAVIVLAASAPEAGEAQRLLAQFSEDMLPSIHHELRTADARR